MTLTPGAKRKTAAPKLGAVPAALLKRIEREAGSDAAQAAPAAWMRAVAKACRGELEERLNETMLADRASGAKRVHYLSMEFLMGRALGNALAALELDAPFAEVARHAGVEPGEVLEREHDAALGNGGLGRLAACFLDSLATLGVPSFGYGLRYRYGMFAQRIQDGRQVETPDDWQSLGDPWEVPRHELRYEVGFGGHVTAEDGCGRRWEPAQIVHADAVDFVVPGHDTRRVSVLRQWEAVAVRPLDYAAFSRGDHFGAAHDKVAAESLNWVLYPDDSTPAGRELRLKQEFFLVSASLQDILARHVGEHGSLDGLGDKVSVHLNDTHPALAVPELMRLLLDEHGLPWDAAFAACLRVMSYTNHTLMPEALETWPVRMFEALLPRHLEIVYEINRRFLAAVRLQFPGDEELVKRVSLIDESGERRVKMAALSIVASHHINGVSALHSELMVQTIFADYAQIFPGRFCNVTNGVTPRRWLAQANPTLSEVLDERLDGNGWRTDLDRLAELAPMAGDKSLQAEVRAAKLANKERLAALVRRELGIAIDPGSLFDVQVKRIHEYKRQLLNLLHVIARYQAIVANPSANWVPRTVIFAGKAASAYVAAKDIIHLIHDVARVVNSDPRVGDKLKLVFLPNYGVSLAETIMPAANLSEQISTAGTEASGTGNMKFALNGALTIGTWDGANIEMAEAVGREHFFIFGLLTEQVAKLRELGYDPRLYVEENLQLKRVIDAIARGDFSPGEPQRYRALVKSLLERDTYLLMADFAGYVQAQGAVDRLYTDGAEWDRKAILNIAGMGAFSSDRTIRDYARNIWNVAT
ncbi:glycogen/starch/alpha-glucan phosphorylase [Rivibacter subsaxonicus]|nr:glycogen/starch/alpha-glucan phosphorylase [Rivibacter subsaxonicus]